MKTAIALLASLFSLTAAADDVLVGPIKGVLAAETPVQLIGEGYDGTEGPLPVDDGGLLFTENRSGRILRVSAEGKVSTFMEESNGSNSLAYNPAGELVSVQTKQPRVGVIQPVQAARTLVEGFDGKPFTRPNDLVVSRRGDLYFSDPNSTPTGLYLLPPGGTLALIASDIARPNGVALSPDERVLYVGDTGGEWVIAFDIAKDGGLSNRRNFARTAGVTKGENGAFAGGTDGLAVDASGRVYAATGIGVQVFDKKGKALGVIKLPKAPQNLAFAGAKRDQLYVVGSGAVYRIPTSTTGPKRLGK
ncbi:MAG: SMP-30/gluconolactonase/LRE family protein [Steroidobacteraceae bacterium]